MGLTKEGHCHKSTGSTVHMRDHCHSQCSSRATKRLSLTLRISLCGGLCGFRPSVSVLHPVYLHRWPSCPLDGPLCVPWACLCCHPLLAVSGLPRPSMVGSLPVCLSICSWPASIAPLHVSLQSPARGGRPLGFGRQLPPQLTVGRRPLGGLGGGGWGGGGLRRGESGGEV